MTAIEKASVGKVPLKCRPRYIVDRPRMEARNSATAILKHGVKIPKDVFDCHVRIVGAFLNRGKDCLTVSKTDLEKVSNIEFMVENNLWRSGPVLVVDELKNDPDNIVRFVKMWRTFFVSTMRPKFLHGAWSINSKCNNDRENNMRGAIDEELLLQEGQTAQK